MISFSFLQLLAAAAALALSPLQTTITTDASGLPTPFADIPNVTIVTYDVTGGNPAAVRRSIDAARPTDPNDGLRVDGLSRYEFRWSWHDDGNGKCSADAQDVLFSATVTIPGLTNRDASAKLREQFNRFRQSLLGHEEGHIRYAWNHRGDIAAAINTASCATASAAARAALKAIAEHDIAYDKATRHGATTILPFG